MTGDADRPPYFFLSYAHTDRDPHLNRFVRDLEREVRRRSSRGDAETVGFSRSFLSSPNIRPGESWSQELATALAESRTFVALLSPSYFNSEWCSREWDAFAKRAHAAGEGRRQSRILPVIWAPVGTLPDEVNEMQVLSPDAGTAATATHGLRFFLEPNRNRDDYHTFLSRLATSIVDVAEEIPLPPTGAWPDGSRKPFESGETDPAPDLSADDPVEGFAARLRELRRQAGNPTYRRLGKIAKRSASELSRATSGQHVPPWDVVAAFVSACGEDAEHWRPLWAAVAADIVQKGTSPAAGSLATEPGSRAVEALGPTGRRVGERLAELRHTRRMTLANLEDKLMELGRPILLSALSKIEQGQRRVDTDDLVALALALDVSPNMILLPDEIRFGEAVRLTEAHSADAAEAWQWASRDVPSTPRWDFFVSYTADDQAWAEWIAWQLEDSGYRVLVQAWDFVPGSNWAAHVRQGVAAADHTIALLSDAYLNSVYGREEWRAVQAADPSGFARKLVPIRVEECPRPGVLGQIVTFDLFGLDASVAASTLLRKIEVLRAGRAKPTAAPAFPTGSVARSTSVHPVSDVNLSLKPREPAPSPRPQGRTATSERAPSARIRRPIPEITDPGSSDQV